MSGLSLVFDTPSLARHYESISVDRQFRDGQFLADEIGVAAGDHILDVGCGTGLLSAYIADLARPDGRVIGIDPLPLRIEIAQQRQTARLSFRVGNAYDLGGFADGSFDIVLLNAVFHWLPEKRGPLREFLRVLKPGGRLGISTISRDHPTRLQSARAAVLVRPPFIAFPEAQDAYALAVGACELSRLLRETGFSSQTVEMKPICNIHASPAAAIHFAQASSFGNFLGHLPRELQDAAEAEIARELECFRTPQGIPQGGARIVAVAIK